MIPLTGHASPDTAYLVTDYPYGFKLRCQIRYWLERHPSRGFRFVSQTENPKTLRWNAPRASTYARLAGAMYLNEEGHVRHAELTEYSDPAAVLAFVAAYPDADVSAIVPFAVAQVRMLSRMLAGSAFLTMNGQKIPPTAADTERRTATLAGWRAVVETIPAAASLSTAEAIEARR
jgi:hypothetical protein